MPEKCEEIKTDLVQIARSTTGTPTAKLVALLLAAGVTSNAEMAEIVGVTVRAIQKVRAMLTSAHVESEPQFAKETNHSSHGEPQFANSSSPTRTTVRQSEPQFASDANSSSPLARTGINSRASKESPTEILISKSTAQSGASPRESCAAAALPTVDFLKTLSERITAIAEPCLANQAIAPGLASMSTPLGWLEHGADLELDVVPTLMVAAKKYRGKGIRSWDYFAAMVAEARAKRAAGLPAVTLPDAAAPIKVTTHLWAKPRAEEPAPAPKPKRRRYSVDELAAGVHLTEAANA